MKLFLSILTLKPLVPIYFENASSTLYDENGMEESRKICDSAKLHFEVAFSSTSPTSILRSPMLGMSVRTNRSLDDVSISVSIVTSTAAAWD